MKLLLIFACLASLLFLSSCDKQKLLLAERTGLEAQLKQGQEELRAIDAKFAALGQDAVTAILVTQRQNAEWLSRNRSLEAELAIISGKCAEGEAAVKLRRLRLDSFRPKIDSYKARFVR